jgi:hypothetical protein
MKRLVVALLLGAGCPAKPPVAPVADPATTGLQRSAPCAAVRSKVERLYRAEAQAREPARVEEAVADNTAMVLNDCAKAPDKVAACIASASTTSDLEARCLAPIDDEGTEGDHVAR